VTSRAVAVVFLVALVLAGCASRTRAPVEERSAATPRPGVPAPAATPGVPAAAPAAAPAPTTAEGDWRPTTYVVKRGDTLYQIALDHGLDYRELAAWNNIENINVIRVGQVLRMTAPGEAPVAGATGVVTAPLRPAPAIVEAKPGAATPGVPAPSAPGATPPVAAGRNVENYKTGPKALKEAYSEQAVRDVTRAATVVEPPPVVATAAPPTIAPAAAPTAPPPKSDLPRVPAAGADDDGNVDWVWPAKGRIVGTFSETANLKGIDIAGTAGQPVVASAGGTVVYAGTGLRGYGKLIIIKHNRTFLSAYAHNREILVKEGQTVTRGQKIAEMGNTDASEVKLHFEIRRLGKPMDPARYLPPA
jgi:lipoprotein NlpD